MSADELEKRIDEDDYTLFDKFLYGGFGYGYFCLPTNLFRVILTVIFPPLGVILKYLEEEFPFFNLKKLALGLNDIIYSILLTMMFYIPGLIYSLSSINCNTASPVEYEK